MTSPLPDDVLARLWRWTYPPVEDRVVSSPARMGIPILLFILDAHLLLRHSDNAALNLLRHFVLFPITCLVSIHCVLGFTLPDARYVPQPAGSGSGSTISWGGQPWGDEETVARSQAELNALGSVTLFFILKAAQLCLSRRPPSLSKERQELQDELNAKQEGVDHQTAASSAVIKKNGKVEGEGALRQRKGGIDASSPVFEKDTNQKQALPWFVPSTRIPLEVDLAISMRCIGWSHGLPHQPGQKSKPVDLLPRRGTPAFASLQTRRLRLIKDALCFIPLAYAVADLSDSVLKSPQFWGERANLGTPLRLGGIEGQEFRFEEFGLLQRVLVTVIVGLTAPFAIQGVYALTVALCLLPAYLFPTSRTIAHYSYADPSHWEPFRLFGTLWYPQSVRDMWSRHWHQAFSPTFRNVVYRPIDRLFAFLGCGADVSSRTPPRTPSSPPLRRRSWAIQAWRGQAGRALRRATATLAVFAVSGLMHEVGVLAQARNAVERDPWRLIGRGTAIPIYRPGPERSPFKREGDVLRYDRGGHLVVFFLLQGLGCVLEDAVEIFSGGRVHVGGVLGSLWTLFVFFFGGMIAAEPVLRRGLAQGWTSLRLCSWLGWSAARMLQLQHSAAGK
ncbi:hypothetical protein OC835_004021 [Tilletia horrida]|nr:hypothetical protein OC835_004021 [Tilletia horrida]